jgi:predicted ATPase
VIVAIKIRNYKGIKATPWIDLAPVHVLVGPNGSGKMALTNILDVRKQNK